METHQAADRDEVSTSVRVALLTALLEALHAVAHAERIVYEQPEAAAKQSVDTIVDLTYAVARVGSAIYTMAEQNHTYGAMALSRQIVEFEYWA
jgi:hypothetical protein